MPENHSPIRIDVRGVILIVATTIKWPQVANWIERSLESVIEAGVYNSILWKDTPEKFDRKFGNEKRIGIASNNAVCKRFLIISTASSKFIIIKLCTANRRVRKD